MREKLKDWYDNMFEIGRKMVGAIEKGFQRAKVSKVEFPTSLDLSMVPNYVSYKAAIIREKMLLQHLCVALFVILAVCLVVGRIETSDLHAKLRLKEYILAPGVNDFIPVSPQSVPDSYVHHAVNDFVLTMGNTNPLNIEERFAHLSSFMSPDLQIQFGVEAKEWIAKAQTENISELMTILEKQIETDANGRFRAIVNTRSDSFIGSESIGFRNEVVLMDLRLVSPSAGRKWYLEITSLSRQSAETYKAAQTASGGNNGK